MSSLGTVFAVSAALLIALFLAATRQPKSGALWSKKTPSGAVVLLVALAVVALLAGIMLAITLLLSWASA